MADEFDLTQLIAGLELSDEEKTKVSEIFGREKNQAELKRGYMARAEASRKMDAADTAQKEAERIKKAAEEKDRNADTFYGTLQEWQKARVGEIEWAQKYRKYLATQGINPDSTVGQDMTDEAAKREAAKDPQFDLSKLDEKYMTKDQLRPIATTAMFLPAQLLDVEAKYRRLFPDKPREDNYWSGTFMKKVTDNFSENKDIFQTAEEEFNFSAKEKENQEADLEKRAQQMAEDKFTALLSTRKLPGGEGFSFETGGADVFTDSFTKTGSDSVKREADAKTHFLETWKDLDQQGVKPY